MSLKETETVGVAGPSPQWGWRVPAHTGKARGPDAGVFLMVVAWRIGIGMTYLSRCRDISEALRWCVVLTQ